MPKYLLYCKDCSGYLEVVHSIKENPSFPCQNCGTVMVKVIGNPTVHLKGDNWTGKLLKEKEIRTRKSANLSQKQKVEHQSDKVVPNVDGEVVSSWKEAKQLAKSKGYDTASYDKFTRK